jgi:hypothetical protein
MILFYIERGFSASCFSEPHPLSPSPNRNINKNERIFVWRGGIREEGLTPLLNAP